MSPAATRQTRCRLCLLALFFCAAGAHAADSTSNRYGYDIEFDAQGNFAGLSIDFAALAEHLYELDRAAKARRIGIELVIFDAPFLPRLFATPRGPYLREHIKFMQGRPWVRHDEHYHVDFAVPCKPLAA